MDRCRYRELVRECFGKINKYLLKERLKSLANKFKGEIFLNHNHKERFYNILHKQDLDIHDISLRYISIIFILTANESLWKSSEEILRSNGIDLNQVCFKGANTQGYALYQTAKPLCGRIVVVL